MRTRSAPGGDGSERERGRVALDRLEVLILARLSVPGRRRPSDAQVARSLHAMLARRLTPSEWRENYTTALGSLRGAGLVERDRLVLTRTGRARLATALRLPTAPRAKSWREFKRRYLPHLLFAGTRARETIDARLGVLAERLEVSFGAKSTTESVLGAWLKKELGFDGAPSLEKVGLVLLARELGLRPRQKPAALLRQSIVLLSGATRDDPDAVLDALSLRWVLDEQRPAPAVRALATPAAPALSTAPATPAAPDDAFVARAVAKIERAARDPSARRYGPDKVFIASVWESLARDPELGGLGEAGFKDLLVDAHRRGLVDLSRADLVAAMDPRDVAASETRHRNATYHFIVRGASA